jgi:hypothetical protein
MDYKLKSLVNGVRYLGPGREKWNASFDSQVFLDVLCEGLVDFGMPLHRLFPPSGGVDIDIVPCSVALEGATRLGQLSDEFGTLRREIFSKAPDLGASADDESAPVNRRKGFTPWSWF